MPIEWFPRLRDAAPEQRSHWRLVGRAIGIRWEDIDEDLSVEAVWHVREAPKAEALVESAGVTEVGRAIRFVFGSGLGNAI